MLKVVIWDTRFFVVFVVMTMLSFAIAFFTLFRLDNMSDLNPEDTTETLAEDAHEEFLSIKSSFATMFSFMLGGFDIEIFNDSRMPVTSNCFFIIYEFIMAVTLLNLLVAVMALTIRMLKILILIMVVILLLLLIVIIIIYY
eukprot:evm.model.scf_133.5 EVM.evm.TU.scf_133.5   scf_133:139845-140696(-)